LSKLANYLTSGSDAQMYKSKIAQLEADYAKNEFTNDALAKENLSD
jgi:hypothetical protein